MAQTEHLRDRHAWSNRKDRPLGILAQIQKPCLMAYRNRSRSRHIVTRNGPTPLTQVRPRNIIRPSQSPAHQPVQEAGQAQHTEQSAGSAIGIVAHPTELGPRWHMGGVRIWYWLHDGISCNGWIQFMTRGRLCTSFGSHKGEWKLLSPGLMQVTFGSCHHVLLLSADSAASARPSFRVLSRRLRDGAPLRNPLNPHTCGYPRRA